MTFTPGIRIKELRTLAQMSQEELGRRIGVQRAAVQKYEKGTVQNVSISTIEKIANVFNVSPTYLVGWENVEANPLSAEVRIIQGVNKFYGADAVDLLETYSTINSIGKRRIQQYTNDMSRIYTDVKE